MINQAQLLPALQRVQMLQQAGRTAEAWSAIAPYRSAIDHHGQALRLYALVAQGSGQVDPAIEALRRIITIEREPPEIVGALADMLGTAGRHDEALTLWTRLTQLLPDVADAHLNRTIAADQAGKHDIAVAAADAGLARFAGHPRLLAAKAVALKNADRIDESLKVFNLAVAADPNRALTRHNQAVALRKACRFEEACAAYSESERLGSSGSRFYANWAAAALEAGQVTSALEKYEQALSDDPANAEALQALTRLKIEYDVGDDPFAHYRSALDARSSSVEAWRLWVGALLSNNRYDLAIETAQRGLIIHPDEVMLAAQEAFAAGMSGDAAPSVDRLEQLFAGGSPPLPWMAQLAIRARQFERAADYALRTAKADLNNQGAWSVLSIVWRVLDDPREQWLCDYERLVMAVDVPSSDGALGPADYAGLVSGVLDPLHNTNAAPGDQSLRQGTQTGGHLFDRPEPAIRQFRESVRQAAEQAVAQLPDDPEHPFLSRKSRRLGFSGSWSVRLRGGGGHHVSHYHKQGWMSSAYYARLPTSSPAARAGHEGWIQFGAPPDMYALDLPPRRLVEPEVGKLVLFPSYMLHGTVPFQSGDRLTAAFDYQPA